MDLPKEIIDQLEPEIREFYKNLTLKEFYEGLVQIFNSK